MGQTMASYPPERMVLVPLLQITLKQVHFGRLYHVRTFYKRKQTRTQT